MYPLILVLGAIDSGKSSIVRWLSQERNATDNPHYPEPREIEIVSYHDGALGKTVTVLETPGFDHPDEDMTDDKILELIGMHFHNNLGKRTDVTGVIYVHRLGDKSVLGGTAKKILQLVYDFCGSEACKNVVFASTSCGGRDEEQTSAIRKQLTSRGVLKQMLDSGAHCIHHDGSETSALHILSILLVKSPARLAFLEHYMRSPFAGKPWRAAQTYMKTGFLTS
ncbi:hypothetical protein D9613_008784 [Agrocybe pediades]|uniref:G domain-containing protein n=1 Tax=Agrocybe pediades TaxID=84607 RepID=A0A8H4QTV9_9AGAR|nr:hypothetical protein D9613_008784 [Agrocybe pediades]